MVVDIIAGARPNFMKVAPIIEAIRKRQAEGGALRHRLVHTGQHYDRAMSGSFFEQLGIPEPDVNLEVGSGSQAEQTGAIMVRYEKAALTTRPAGPPVAKNWNPQGYLKNMPLDPWGTPYQYLNPGTHSAGYDLFSLGSDGVAGGEGYGADIGNWSN